MYKTTKKDFAEFKGEVGYWKLYFGLLNWEVECCHADAEGSRARCWVDIPGRMATLELALSWNETPQKNSIKLSAFHEICELLLRDLSGMCEAFYSKRLVDQKTHDVIRRLENTIFKEHRG